MFERDVPRLRRPALASGIRCEAQHHRTRRTVVLRATIGTDGKIDDVNVVSSPHADLSSAAMDAVRQWEFDATLLNCVPVAVTMKVTVNFERER